MTPAFRENLGLGLGVLGTGLAAYGAFAGPGKPKNPKRWQDFRKEYEDKNKALDAQRDLEIKQKFPKYYRLGQQLDDARAEKYTYLDMDYIDEGHPLWPKYEKAYDKVRDLEVKYWNAEDKYGPQGLTAIKDKYQKLKDENHQAYLKGVDTFNGLGEAKSIGAMLGGLGLIGVGGKLLSKTAADSDFLQKRKTPLTLVGMAGLAAGVHEATKPLDMIASRRSLIKDYAPQVANAKTRAKDSIAWLRKNGVDNPNAWMYKDELQWARNDLRMSRPFLRRYKDDLKYLLKRRNIGLGVAALGAGAILGANALSKSAAAEKKYEELSNTQMGLPVGSGIGTAFAVRNHYVNKAKTFTKNLANVEDQLQFQTAWNQKSRNASSLGRALSKLEHSSLNKEKALLESKLFKAYQNQRKIPKRILGATAATAAGMGLYNAVQRAKQKGYEQRQAWYAKRKEKTASKQTDARKQALTYSVAGMGTAVYGMNALAKARQTLEAARLREKLVNTKIVGDAAVEAARTGRPSNPVVYAKDGTLAVQSAKQALAKHRKRNLAITAAGLGLLAYGNHINPDNQVYVKTSAENPRPLNVDERINAAIGGASGGLAIGSGLANLYARKALGVNTNDTDMSGGHSARSFAPPNKDTLKNFNEGQLHDKKVGRRVSSVAKRMGYKQSVNDAYTFTSKSGKTVHFNPVKTVKDNAWINDIEETMSAAKADLKAPNKSEVYKKGIKDFISSSKQTGRNLTLGSKPQFTDRATIAHELGHGQQSKRFLRLAGRTAKWPLYGMGLGAAQAALSDESNGGEGYALATIGSLPRLANEFDASRRGAKAFRSTAGKLRAFKGLPTYALMAAAPAAAWGVTKAFKTVTRRTDPVR